MKNEVAEVLLSDKGYLELRFTEEDLTLSESQVQKGWALVQEMDPEARLPVLLITAPWSLIDRTAFPVVTQEIKKRPLVAIVVHDLSQKLIGNFVLNISSISGKAKLFNREEQARIWLLDKMKQG